MSPSSSLLGSRRIRLVRCHDGRRRRGGLLIADAQFVQLREIVSNELLREIVKRGFLEPGLSGTGTDCLRGIGIGLPIGDASGGRKIRDTRPKCTDVATALDIGDRQLGDIFLIAGLVLDCFGRGRLFFVATRTIAFR